MTYLWGAEPHPGGRTQGDVDPTGLLTPLPGLLGQGSQADLNGTCRPQATHMERASQSGSGWGGYGVGSQSLGPSVAHGAITGSVSGVLPGQVCFIFPTPCQKHPAFASVLSTRSNSSQVSAELHMPDFALGAPTATISFKEPSIPGSAHDSFCPTLLRLSLRGVKPLTQGHTASSGRAPPIPVHVQWGCVASLEHTLGLCWNFPCMSK